MYSSGATPNWKSQAPLSLRRGAARPHRAALMCGSERRDLVPELAAFLHQRLACLCGASTKRKVEEVLSGDWSERERT